MGRTYTYTPPFYSILAGKAWSLTILRPTPSLGLPTHLGPHRERLPAVHLGKLVEQAMMKSLPPMF